MKIIKNSIYTVAILLVVFCATLLVAGRFGIGGVRALVVQSGSMEPTISTKSIVVTAPVGSYTAGDVVTFKQSGREQVLVTHRVVKVENGQFTTKGDANEGVDSEIVPAQDVVGKVIFSVPFVGSIISFAQTQVGFTILVVIPAVAIVYSELLNIKNSIVKFFVSRKEVAGQK